jgi:hypothetical protein
VFRNLEGREYKLLLDPRGLSDEPTSVNDFYERTLRKILSKGKERRVDGLFGPPKDRDVRFFDTADLSLDAAGFCLRRRRSDDKGDINLKLRLPDLFVVASTPLNGRDAKAKPRFEEDISPLEVATAFEDVKIAEPPSIRSRFALSTKQKFKAELDTLGDVFELYPSLRKNLRLAGQDAKPASPLRKGPRVRERVFDGPELNFGHGVKAGVTLAFWKLAPEAPAQNIAEISYRCETPEGRIPGGAAREALALFLDLQRELDVEVKFPSKTKLALPARA